MRRRLGRTDLEISPLGLGSWAFGGAGWAFGWGPQDDADSRATVLRAAERGINWIDTAALYGLGHAEEVVGRALAELPPADRPLVFTKGGLPWKKRKIRHRLTADSLRREVEASLSRLRVEAIDLYQIHWPDLPPNGPARDLEEGFRALLALRAEGKIRHVGVCNFDVDQLERLRPIEEPASLQPPYSLARRDVEREILPYCAARGMGVLVYSPMESGLLSGRMTRERIRNLPPDDWRSSKSEEFREPRLTRNLAIADRLRRVGSRRNRTAGEVAVAWVLRNPAVTAAIVGARRPEQLDEIAGALELELSEDEARELEVNPTSPS